MMEELASHLVVRNSTHAGQSFAEMIQFSEARVTLSRRPALA
jgi:hypothetical protein